MINHFVVVTSILSIQYNWVSVLITITDGLHTLSAFLSEFIKFKCLLQSSTQIQDYLEAKAGRN